MSAVQPTVLVLSDDPMSAALLGLLLELASYRPVFSADGERPEDAIARVRPLFVVLVDGGLDATRSDIFFARAAQQEIGIAVFTAPGREVAPRLRERGIVVFELPLESTSVDQVIRMAAASHWWHRGSDRRVPRTEYADDGGLVFQDRTGQRWSVYDRRGGDRRRGLRDATTREFVSEIGETRQTTLRDGEGNGNDTAFDLEQQFLRSIPV